MLVYLGGAEKPPILRVYVEENPIEEDHNVDEGQHDMLNDEFDPADMNNHDDEIGIGEGEGLGRTLRETFMLHLWSAAKIHVILNLQV